MHATFEYNIHNRKQNKIIHTKVWKTDRSSGCILLEVIAVVTTKEGSRKIAEINIDPLDPAIDHILKYGTSYAILSVPKDRDMFSPLSRRLPWCQSEDEGFMQDRVDNDEAQKNSPSTDSMFMVSPSTVPNIMKCKHTLQNESDGNPRSYSTILVTTQEVPVLVSTQEVLAALFLSNVNSQDDVQIDTCSLKIESIHEYRESTLVNQEINNISQIKQQDINNRILTESHSGYKFRHHTISNCKSSSRDYIPGDPQHEITAFNFDCAPTPSQQ
ncbi:hypothetical protein G6F37_001133 [Rhizopus arrhizus]|nr:hypothetical protein G6F38_001463 [Rhizopus arrhizus]KAG1163519.1 hypothetical protein G6F37_001133 [Rhizopus arrhizus]